MRLTLNQFRCYQNREFEITDGVITLITGTSGVGKTTILESIYFVLYGTLQKVNPHTISAPKAKTWVSLESPHFTILRKKNPNFLQFVSRGITYTNLEAQEEINKEFGKENVWLSTSYVMQNDRSPLLSYSNQERMAIIKYLSFREEDPSRYTQILHEALTNIQKQLQEEQTKYLKDHEWIQREIEINKVSFDQCLQEEELNSLKQKRITLLKDLELATRKLEDSLYLEARRETLSKIITDTKTKLSSLSMIPDDSGKIITYQGNLDELKKKYYQQQEQLKQQDANRRVMKQRQILLDSLMEERKVLDKECPSWESLKPLPSLDSTQQQEHDYRSHFQVAEKLQVPYTKSAVDQLILRLEETEEKQKIYHKYLSLNSQRQKLAKDVLPYPITQEEIHKMKKKYEDGLRSLDILSCPKCNQGLRYLSGKLILDDKQPVTPEELKKWKQQHELLTAQKRIQDQIQQLDQEISLISTTSLTPDEQKPVTETLRLAKSIRFYDPPPVASGIIQKIKDWNKDKANLDQYPIVEDKSFTPDPELPHQIKKLEMELVELRKVSQEAQANNQKIKMLTQELEKNEAELLKLPPPVIPENPEVIRTEIKNLDTLVASAIKANETLSLETKHQEHYSQLASMVEDGKALESLLKRASGVECMQLESTVHGINSILNDIITLVFPSSPMTAVMSLSKLTTTDKMKQVVNFTINYQDATITSLKQMSGGEGDRLSFALFLTLSCISNSPILLLDEPFGSLDSELRDYCITAMRKVANGKTIICIGHEEVGGRYDKTLAL
jgi:ABC-type lipoprotein export system ATPase subunit